MAWRPPPDIELDDAYYDIMPKITQSSWNRFARSALRLDQNEIEEITTAYPRDVKERKFQMFARWQEKNGAAATVDTIYAVLNHFIRPHECPKPDLCTGMPAMNKVEMKIPQNRADAVPFVEDAPTAIPAADYCESVQRVQVQKSDLSFYNRTVTRQTGSIYQRKGKGRTFILNNMFHHLEKGRRAGAEIDLRNMKELWKNLGSEVVVHTDLTASDLKRALKFFAEECAGCDYCVVFIMSHGGCKNGHEVVLGNDHGDVNVEEIKEMFDNNHAHYLQEIPKLFFFQCCRGDVPDIGVPLSSGSAATFIRASTGPVVEPTSADATSARVGATVADADPNAMLPRLSDILIAHATQSGYQAFRNTTEGSWFVNAIANVFMRHAKDEHVADLMTKVHDAVSTQSTNTSDRSMAMPEAKSTLRRKLYLFPGIKFQ